MPRFRLLIEYAGTRYSGCQIQKNARTVQGEIDRAVRGVSRRQDFELYGSGRTDAGVHALAQVAHLELYTSLAAEALRALPRLRMATVCGIGTDAFDLVVARERDISICNIPGKTEVASVFIFGQIESGNTTGAAAVSVVLLAISLAILIALGAVARRGEAI